jgi:hypothetical protein
MQKNTWRALGNERWNNMNSDDTDNRGNVGHEPIGTDVGAVWLTAIGLAAVVLIGFLIVWGMMSYFSAKDIAVHGPKAVQPPLPLGVPKLSSNQPLERRNLRELQEELLSTYGWINHAEGIARIPLSRAMQMIAADGFPKPTSMPQIAEQPPTEGSEPQ